MHTSTASSPPEWDFIIVGSGFGGSVSALRLVEKGYRVLLLEKGRAFAAADFPKTNWQLWRWLWAPMLGFRGLFQMRFARHATILSGVGLGGGSLVYANTHPTPPQAFFEAPAWRDLADWHGQLTPHYQTVRRMLGVNPVPFITATDQLLRESVPDPDKTVRPTEVAVFFGDPGVEVDDPYFGGAGPRRRGCIRCGACMTGCRHGAKNSLDLNYLHLARQQGLEIATEAEVDFIGESREGSDQAPTYTVRWRSGAHRPWRRRRRQRARAQQVIVSAGVLGSVELLDRMRRRSDGLPGLSERLGQGIRTNSEALIGITSLDAGVDMSQGVAIGAIHDCGDDAHAELVRYGAGSGAFRVAVTPHVEQGRGLGKLTGALAWALQHPWRAFRSMTVPDWAKATTILLYMRCGDERLRLVPARGWLRRLVPGLVDYDTELDGGVAPTATLPQATALARTIAERCNGELSSLATEAATDRPTTAHILGGCAIAAEAMAGVIDDQHRCFGHPGVRVIDGSSLPANPGVNPSLTIAALAERAMSFIPDRPAS